MYCISFLTLFILLYVECLSHTQHTILKIIKKEFLELVNHIIGAVTLKLAFLYTDIKVDMLHTFM